MEVSNEVKDYNLPIEQGVVELAPNLGVRYALVFNIKRAEQLGIKIPSDILMAADEVVLDSP